VATSSACWIAALATALLWGWATGHASLAVASAACSLPYCWFARGRRSRAAARGALAALLGSGPPAALLIGAALGWTRL
jgi:hypothetical protein